MTPNDGWCRLQSTTNVSEVRCGRFDETNRLRGLNCGKRVVSESESGRLLSINTSAGLLEFDPVSSNSMSDNYLHSNITGNFNNIVVV